MYQIYASLQKYASSNSKQYDYLQFSMEQAQPNSQSIQQEQKQEMQQEQQQQSIIAEATSEPIEEEKQDEEQIENQEDLVDEQVENKIKAIPEEKANNLVQQQVQEEKQQVQQQRQAPLQEEVDNSIQAEVQKPMQNDEQRLAQPQQIENQQQEVEAQAQAQQQQIPPNQENQPQLTIQNQPNISQLQQVENLPSRSEENIIIRNEEEIQENIRKQRENDSQKTQQYIHKLERQLQSISTENNILKRDMATLRETQNKLRQDFQSNKQTVMDLRKKKLETQFQKTKALKECDKFKKENEFQRKKIEEIQKIGDIIVLKNALQELNALTQAQKQEIEQLKSTTSHPLVEQLKQQLLLLQDYQNTKRKHENQIQGLQVQNKMLLEQLTNLNNSLSSERNQVQKLNKKQLQLQQKILQLNTTIKNWQNRWHEFQNQRESNAKSRELQKKIFDYESQKNMGYQNEVIHLNVLSDREEKDIILKEYLILEGKFKQQQFEFEETKSKLRKVQRQQARIYTSYIKKKQYNDLSIKYNKAKKCLEGAFRKLRLIRNDESQTQNIQDQVNELLEGTQARQCQQVIKKAQGIVSSLRDKIDGFQHNQNILSNKREYERMQQTIKLLNNEQAQNERILRLMADDIKLKNKLIAQKNQIIETLRKRTLLMPNQAQNYKVTLKLSSEVASLRETLSVFETQNILLVKEISSLNSQVAHWKHLYNNIKDSLRQKINTSLQQKNTNGPSRIIGEQSISICKECEQRKLYLSSKDFESNQTQTDNLNQFYYKQIKDILAFLNKVAKECEKVPQLSKQLSHSINQIKEKFIIEFKEKYLRIQAHYNSKLNELKREKADNESWRVRAKEQIREEFQDIRELIINNRLANALRQAKNLIDYLEVQVQKQDQQNQQQEMEQQNPVQEKKDE